MADRLLSPVISERLDALARRLRRQQLLIGLCWLAILMPTLGAVLVFADGWFHLSVPWFRAAVATGLFVALLAAVRGLVFPWYRRQNRAELAVLVERSNPDLAERLTSVVLLAGKNKDAGYGAASFIGHLERETAERLQGIDLTRCLAGRPGPALALTAAACLVLSVAAASFLPQYRASCGRLYTCWLEVQPGLQVEVSPGNAPAAAGRPLTVSALLTATDPSIRVPENCYLCIDMDDGPKRLLMIRRKAAFSHTLATVAGSFDYHMEGEGFKSASYRITAVEPVELTSNPTVTIRPPDYVNPQFHPRRAAPAEKEISVLEYSDVRFNFALSRPAVAGRLEIAGARTRSPEALLLPVSLAADRHEATIQLPSLPPGEYTLKLVLEAEHGIETVRLLPGLHIWTDEPPAFTQFQRRSPPSASTSQVPPDDVIPLPFVVEDKVGLAAVELEFRVNGGRILSELIARPEGKPALATEYLFDLRGKVKEGDVLEYRLKAADNRRLARGQQHDAAGKPAPSQDLLPQHAYDPAAANGKDVWHTVVISRKAKALAEQDILARQHRFAEKLRGLQKHLESERKQLRKARAVSEERVELTPELKNQLESLSRANRDLQKELRELALETFTSPDWQDLAEPAFALSENELRKAGELVEQARNHALEVGHRDKRLHAAAGQLAQAAERLEEMLQKSGRLASDQLDQQRLASLAKRQENLENEAAAAEDAGQLQSLSGEEANLGEALQELLSKSKLLQDSVAAAKSDPHQALATMADKQQELAKRAAKLVPHAGGEAKMNAAQAAASSKKALEHMTAAAELMKKQDLPASAREMKVAEVALDRLAQLGGPESKEGKPGANMSPRAEAAELARRQKELREVLTAQMAKRDSEANRKMAGQALQESQKQVEMALKALRQSQRGPARAAMSQAAKALQRAANSARKQSARSGPAAVVGKDNRPRGPSGSPSAGTSDPRLLAEDLRQYLGTRWGDLPGEMKTQLLQDLRGRFGEEYSRIIRDYFERLAEP